MGLYEYFSVWANEIRAWKFVAQHWADIKKLKCNIYHSSSLSFSYSWRKPRPNHSNFSKLASKVLKMYKN